MRIYDARGLAGYLGIGRDAAYNILREYGFRVGVRQLRITEKQIEKYIEEMKDAQSNQLERG